MTTDALRSRLHQAVLARLREAPDGRPRRDQLPAALHDALAVERVAMPSGERRELERQLDDRLFGLGPLAPLLRDERVSEVMVNGPKSVWVEREGRLERTGVTFEDDDALLVVIERLVAPLGRRIDLATPLVDARLPDGSRVHAVIPPISLAGPVLTIRRFTERPLGPDDLVRLGTCDAPVMARLVRAVHERRSILVCGGTSSGKTTTLNALAHAIGVEERIVTIEDAAELRLPQPNVVSLETRGPSVEGTGAVDVRTLIRAALRMRPDRIVVGEVRGGEALDMLLAMSSGHDGSLSTIHAGSPEEAVRRVETLALMADVGLPHAAVRERVAEALDLVVHQERDRDGARRVVAVSEVVRVAAGPATREVYLLRGERPVWRAPLSDALARRLEG